jgi:channel protein (hemolysin III family)
MGSNCCASRNQKPAICWNGLRLGGRVPAQNRELRHYSNMERLVDAQVHFLGIACAVGGCAWLVSQMSGDATIEQIVALAVYAFGLVSMPVASALYNMARTGRIKARLRQLDHVMIFVMIAGTYTPFALLAFRSPSGVLLLAAVWMLAAIGAGLKVTRLYNNEAVSVAMYLVLWMALPPAVAGAFCCAAHRNGATPVAGRRGVFARLSCQFVLPDAVSRRRVARDGYPRHLPAFRRSDGIACGCGLALCHRIAALESAK